MCIRDSDDDDDDDDDDDEGDESSTDLMKASRDDDTSANARGSSFISQIASRCGSFFNSIYPIKFDNAYNWNTDNADNNRDDDILRAFLEILIQGHSVGITVN